MTQQFKFGDMVRDKHTQLGICVVINATEHFVYIMNENGHYNTIANPGNLEHIPHPDTMRLNWLMEEGIIPEDIYYNTQSEDDDGLPYAYFSKHDCRAAIDSAMRRNRK